MKAAGTPAKTSSNGLKTSEPPKIMWSPAQSAILPTPADPDSQTDHDKEGHRTRSHNPQLHITRVVPRHLHHQRPDGLHRPGAARAAARRSGARTIAPVPLTNRGESRRPRAR